MPKFDEQGLLPVVVQDDLTGEVRMLAWADEAALARTRAEGHATFFSRSRQAAWKKGETSGNVVDVRRIELDCDEDAALYLGTPHGPTCHTGTESCFRGAPAPFLLRLEAVLEARKSAGGESYTKSLFDEPARIGEKVREEADELSQAFANETDERVIAEAADVVFHVMVGLRQRGVTWRSVLEELDRRFGTSGHAEKAARKRV